MVKVRNLSAVEMGQCGQLDAGERGSETSRCDFTLMISRSWSSMGHRRLPRLDVAPILEGGPRLRSFRAYISVVDGVDFISTVRLSSLDEAKME